MTERGVSVLFPARSTARRQTETFVPENKLCGGLCDGFSEMEDITQTVQEV